MRGGLPAIASAKFPGVKGILFYVVALTDEEKESLDRRKRFYASVRPAKCCLRCKHSGYEYHPENDDGEEDQLVCNLAWRLPIADTAVCDKYENNDEAHGVSFDIEVDEEDEE